MIEAVFYRNQGAYLVGRISSGGQTMPLTLALHHPQAGISVDAVLLTADEVSIIFSFTRSYFHVEVRRPRDLVAFLKSIMPRKPVAELYIAIGYNKHGKTELYRDLMRHIDQSTDPFEIARGDRGMVMCVFTLPVLRRRVQGHPRPVRLSQDLVATRRDGAVPARLQARPRRPAGRRPGVRAPGLRPQPVLGRSAERAGRRGWPRPCSSAQTSSRSSTFTSSGG